MTLLSICQQVARETGFTVPDTIISNAEETAARLLALAQTSGKALARRAAWQELRGEHTITTTAGDADYALSGVTNYGYIIGGTWWDRTRYWPLGGPLTPQQWQEVKSGLLQASVRYYFRIFGNQINLHPTPSSTDTLVFEYVKNVWCESAGGTDQTAWTADTDVGLLEEFMLQLDLKWRFLKAMGMDYAEEYREAEREINQAIARNADRRVLSLNTPDPAAYILAGVTPETGFGT